MKPILLPMRWWHIEAAAIIDQHLFGSTAWTPAQFWSELARENREYVALVNTDREESAHQLIGYAGLAWTPPEADVQTIAVSRTAQGKGLGSKLLEHLVTTARLKQCRRLLLEVAADNATAVRMYTKFGFHPISRRSGYYGPGADAVIMERSLVQAGSQ